MQQDLSLKESYSWKGAYEVLVLPTMGFLVVRCKKVFLTRLQSSIAFFKMF